MDSLLATIYFIKLFAVLIVGMDLTLQATDFFFKLHYLPVRYLVPRSLVLLIFLYTKKMLQNFCNIGFTTLQTHTYVRSQRRKGNHLLILKFYDHCACSALKKVSRNKTLAFSNRGTLTKISLCKSRAIWKLNLDLLLIGRFQYLQAIIGGKLS